MRKIGVGSTGKHELVFLVAAGAAEATVHAAARCALRWHTSTAAPRHRQSCSLKKGWRSASAAVTRSAALNCNIERTRSVIVSK